MPHQSLIVAGCSLFIASTALAQPCNPTWTTQPIGQPGIDGVVNDMVVWDDGSGPALYASGSFPTAGNADAVSVAKWDGLQWSRLGTGLTRAGRATRVPGLAVYDDGSGEALYATGGFDSAGGVPASGIAKWDGSAWSAVGVGIVGQGFKMTTYDDGQGEHLYLGGSFTIGSTMVNLARWDGTSWRSIGTADASVNILVVHDDGSGPALFIGGNIQNVQGVSVSGVAKFQGGTWSALGAGVTGGLGRVNALAVFDDTRGSKLFVGGNFTAAGGIPADNIAAWDGAAWQRIAAGGPATQINAMGVYDDGTGSGESLFIGGQFDFVGGQSNSRIARYDGTAWSSLGSGLSTEPFDGASEMRVFDDGQGRALFVGGGFTSAGGQPANSIAQWGGCTSSCPCACDFDTTTGAGVCDIVDFVTFAGLFTQGDPCACDIDTSTGPGVCDIVDFVTFAGQFAAGCP